MPRAVNDAKVRKQRHQSRVLGDLAERTIDEIGGVAKVATVIKEGLDSTNSYVRNKAMTAVIDLAKNGSPVDAEAGDLTNDELEQELFAYLRRTLIDMGDADYRELIDAVDRARADRTEGLAMLARAKEAQPAPAPADFAGVIQKSPLA